jgi:uncharacterized protein YoxC
MEVVLYIAASIALLALAGLFIYLIFFIRSTRDLIDNITKTVNSLVEEVKTVRLGLQGTMQNLQGITGKIETTMDRVNGQLDHVDGIVGSVQQMTSDASRIVTDGTDVIHAAKGVVISLIDLEQEIQEKVQAPIVETMTIFSALGKGLKAFRGRLANGDSNGHVTTDIYYKQ